jgi:periplasmic protein TonB
VVGKALRVEQWKDDERGGRIENLQIVSGPPMLRSAAIEAVKTWRYRPYLLNNQPVELQTAINIIFTLGPGQ